MTNGRGCIVIAAALATLVSGMPVDAAKKKNRLRATVNGKLIKFKYNVQITAGGMLDLSGVARCDK